MQSQPQTYSGRAAELPKPSLSLPRWKPESLRPIWMKACSRTTARSAALLHDPVTFFETFAQYEGEPIRFDPWQRAYLRDHSRFRACEKAPQIGFSWLTACEAVWDAIMHLDSTSAFVSVDMREASEKILYARKLYAELPEVFQAWVPLSKDSSDELWLGDAARPSRIMSLPSTTAAGIRGKRMSVYLDEVDFYKDGGRDAFRQALTRLTRGGHMTMGSTCFGIDTKLDEVMQGKERNFSRARLPWSVAEQQSVVDMITIARQELSTEDFEEEYECVRGGSGIETFSADLLRFAAHELSVSLTLDDAISRGTAQMIGYDVGASRHPAIATLIEHGADRVWRQTAIVEMRGMSLPKQQAQLEALLKEHPTLSLCIDALGIGMHIAQALEAQFGSRIVLMKAGSRPEDMPKMDKSEMTTELKRALEAGELQIALDREQSLQLRRTRLAAGSKVEQPGSKRATHYDRFWALAYAWYAVRNAKRESVYERRGLIVIGGHNATDRIGRRLHSQTT